MVTKSVVVLPYDEQWEQAFAHIKDEIQEALGSLALSIEHVGSTSVRGLSAKPIIDIDVVIKDYSVFDAVVTALEEIGYHHSFITTCFDDAFEKCFWFLRCIIN